MLQNKNDAIQRLQAMGFEAYSSDSTLGSAIRVMAGRVSNTPDELPGYKWMVWIQHEKGDWQINDFSNAPRVEVKSCDSLESAVQETAERLYRCLARDEGSS